MRNFTRSTLFFVTLILIIITVNFEMHDSKVSAATTLSGTFVSVNYDYVEVDKDKIEKQLRDVTLKLSNGKEVNYAVIPYAKLLVDGISTKIEAFKLGMPIHADITSGKLQGLYGETKTEPGQINPHSKVVIGTITEIDPAGNYIQIKLDNQQVQYYYINDLTNYQKAMRIVDISAMFEGDRVKLKFSSPSTNTVELVEIIDKGIQVEGLFKGTIQYLDPNTKKLKLTNTQQFLDWRWQPILVSGGNQVLTYNSRVPIYVGKMKISAARARYYSKNPVYFVTRKQGDQQIVEKMIIQPHRERSYYKPLSYMNTKSNMMGIRTIGTFSYHDGTIFIRNGRLVDETSLLKMGTAQVFMGGISSNQYINIVHVTNDGFQSPNLYKHELYYGQLIQGDYSTVTIQHAQKLVNNNWIAAGNQKLSYSNDTFAVEERYSSLLTILTQQDELKQFTRYGGYWGYYYVNNGHVEIVHLTDASYNINPAPLVSVGRIDRISLRNTKTLVIRNVSHWKNGNWIDAGKIQSMNIEQATFIKDGRAIQPEDLEINDRVYFVHVSNVKGKLFLVD